jgi:hypothetical protein
MAVSGDEFLYVSTEEEVKSSEVIGATFADDLVSVPTDPQDQPQDQPQEPRGLPNEALSLEDNKGRETNPTNPTNPTAEEVKVAEADEDNDEDEEGADTDEDEGDCQEEVVGDSEALRRRYVGYSDLPFVPDDVTIVDLIQGHVAINCRGQEVQIPVLMSLMMMSIIGFSPATFFVSIGVGLPLSWLVQSALRWATKGV